MTRLLHNKITGVFDPAHMGKVSLMMLAIHCNSAEYLLAV